MGKTRNCFKFIIALIQLLGGLPVTEKGNKVIFQWKSLKTFYLLCLLLFSLIHIFEDVLEYERTVFDISGTAIQISFLIMAVRWPELAKECDKIDLHMKGYGFPKYLKLKVYAICIMLTILRLFVYSLFDVTMSTSARIEAHTFIDVGRAAVVFFKQNASFMDGCKMLLVILKHLSHWRVVMLRCYVDVFIITTSVILTVRNHQLGERVELLIQARIRDVNIWKRTREDYQRLFIFCKKLDYVLGYLILCSFVSNIYALFLHIQNALKHSDAIDKIYTSSASIEYLFRCMLICYTAGSLYEESQRFIQLLVLTPSDMFNDEIERMILRLQDAQPALTGKQLFTVKHSLILQILAGITIYELLQYYYTSYTQ